MRETQFINLLFINEIEFHFFYSSTITISWSHFNL